MPPKYKGFAAEPWLALLSSLWSQGACAAVTWALIVLYSRGRVDFQTSHLFSKTAKSLFPLRCTTGLKFSRSKQCHQSQSTGPGLQESGSPYLLETSRYIGTNCWPGRKAFALNKCVMERCKLAPISLSRRGQASYLLPLERTSFFAVCRSVSQRP